MAEQIVEKQEKVRKIGSMIVLGCCFIGTVVMLILFSQPGFHENTDNMFRQIISFFVELWYTMPWGIILLISGLVVPLVGLLATSPLDRLTRRIPFCDLPLNYVRLSFEYHPGLRFLPAFVTIVYLVTGAFMQGADSGTDFDPDSYNPFAYQYSAGEWVNWCFMVLAVFAVFLIVAEGIVNAGWLGMVIHIPLVLAANVYLVVLFVGIMFVAVTLLGFIGKLLAAIAVLPVVAAMGAVGRNRKEVVVIRKE